MHDHAPGHPSATEDTFIEHRAVPEGGDDAAALAATLRDRARDLGMYVWDGLPEDEYMSSVEWPNTDSAAFLDVAHQAGARILYLSENHAEDGTVLSVEAMFALHGIYHWFPAQPADDDTAVTLVGTNGSASGRRESAADEVDSENLHEPWNWAPDPYVSWVSGARRKITEPLRQLVDRVVDDPAFDSRHGNPEVLLAAVADLDPSDAADVRYVAPRVFDQKHGNALDKTAEELAPSVIRMPDYSPLFDEDNRTTIVEAYLRDHQPDADPRLLWRLVMAASNLAWENGERERADRALKRTAAKLLRSLPADVRDQFGFASRRPQQLAVLAPYLSDIDSRLHDHLLTDLRALESTDYAATREARYATASRTLITLGKNRSAVSRFLGVSTAVLQRIESTHRKDVQLAPEDPIFERVPALRLALG